VEELEDFEEADLDLAHATTSLCILKLFRK
jgi:hypothetical protein